MLTATGVGFAYGTLRRRRVFDALDWTVPVGRRTLLLGPNGAGKSTLIELLCGHLAPRRGSVTLDAVPSRAALRADVAWMPQTIVAIPGFTVSQQVEYAAWVAGASRAESRARAADALSSVRLDDQRDERATELSGGQLRRVGLAQAIVRRGRILLLDEPTAGLDPAQTQNFRELMREIDAPGGLVVSTHQVRDLATDVDHVAVLLNGHIVFDGSVPDFAAHGRAVGARSEDMSDVFSAIVSGGLH